MWYKLVQLSEEGGAEQVERLQLWRQMTQFLQDSVEEQDNETQQHVSAEMALSNTVRVGRGWL